MDSNTIYVVRRSISWDIYGETTDISYHKTIEGAAIKMDEIAPEYGFSKEDISNTGYNDSYFYHRENESLSIDSITLED